ncbi:MAG: ATP-binding protein [Candidatus Methanoplasma sp.]|jgi:AAA+ ATPase superfamily predicted ATPase|nr:ATP-binding protein [Candidatus Methanoplasma sp.]
MVFVGRTDELAKFGSRYDSANAELVFLYGRRRVGKTEFLRKFSEGKEALFFSATESYDSEQRERFKQRMLSFGFDGEPSSLNDWEGIFRGLRKLKFKGKKLVIIDEFQYIFTGKRAVPSILQNIWDEYLSHENIMLVLCGSAMSFIENEVLGSKNPLYGRATAIFKMRELAFEEAMQFFPDYTLKEKIVAYAILGGIPFYLKQFSSELGLEENIKRNIFSRETILYNEAEFMLKQELRETSTYNTIISAIALGNTKLNEISKKTQINASKVNVYLKNLIDLGLISKENSILDAIKKSANVQRGLYKISDKFFRFWYRYVYPNKDDVEAGDMNLLMNEIIESINTDYTSLCFEELCIEYIRKMNSKRELPFIAKQIGKVWAKGLEVDLGATDGTILLLGEYKWTNSPVGIDVLNSLKDKVSTYKELSGYERYFLYLFSKTGFTKAVMDEAERGDVTIVDVDSMFKS